MAERVGFEPTRDFSLPIFETGALDQLCDLSVSIYIICSCDDLYFWMPIRSIFFNEEKWLGFVLFAEGRSLAGSLAGTDAGSVGFRCFVLRTTISAVAATRPLFRKPPMGQASRTRHKAPEKSRPAAMAHGKEKSPRLFSSLKKTQNQNRYAAASCLLDLSSHQYSTAVTPAPKTIPQPNSRAMPLRVGTQMSARYSRKAPP